MPECDPTTAQWAKEFPWRTVGLWVGWKSKGKDMLPLKPVFVVDSLKHIPNILPNNLI